MSVGGFIRRKIYWSIDFLKGSPIGCHFNDIKSILNDNKKGKIKQETYLNNLLKHAVKNSHFYNGHVDKDLEHFPVMNKMDYLTHYESIKVDLSLIPFHKGKMHIISTSGSTGTMLVVPQDFRKRNRVLAELKYFGEIAGYKSHERLVQLRIWKHGQYKSKIQTFKENIFAFGCTKMDEGTLNNLCSLIKKKNIVAILGYASWFGLFAQYIENNSIKLVGIKIIITGGEMLQNNIRFKLKKLIGCNVVSRYANQEQGILGQELINDEHFYLNHASYYFEILKFDNDEKADYGEIGRIVITDLYNYAFPMIRYDTGDAGIMAAGNHLSKGYPVLYKIYGRRVDMIYDTNGSPVHPHTITAILNHLPDIIQWQFIQKTTKQYLLRINGNTKMNYKNVISEMKNIFGNHAEISIEFVDKIPVLASGNGYLIICELKK